MNRQTENITFLHTTSAGSNDCPGGTIPEAYPCFCSVDSGSDTESLESYDEPLVYETPILGMTIYFINSHWSSTMIFVPLLSINTTVLLQNCSHQGLDKCCLRSPVRVRIVEILSKFKSMRNGPLFIAKSLYR